MSDPVTWAILGGVGYGIYKKVDEERQIAKNQAKVAEANALLQQQQMEYNQRMAEREAQALEAEGIENARRMRAAAELERSQRIAMLGKSGTAMSSGSPLAVLGAAAASEEMSIRDNKYNTARQISQLETKAKDYAFGAKVAENDIQLAKNSRPSMLSFGFNLANTTAGVVKTGASVLSIAG